MDNFINDKKNNKNLNPKKLMQQIQNEIDGEKLKLEKYIEFIYLNCMRKIEIAIKFKETDIFYIVPSENNEYPKYNPSKCLDYIQKKLRKNKFQTLIINNDNMIFITWKYLNNGT